MLELSFTAVVSRKLHSICIGVRARLDLNLLVRLHHVKQGAHFLLII